MNNKNLAIQISKHPLIELLKKNKTIPNNLIARLIVEELMLENPDDAAKQIESAKSLEELEKIYKELEPSISGMPRVRGRYEEKKKELAAAQPEKKPEDIKGLIVDTLGDAVADQIVAKIITPVLNKVNVVAAGASAAGGPLIMLGRAALGFAAQKGIEAAVKTACKSFVNSVLSSFKAVDTVNDKLGVLFGKALETKIVSAKTMEERKNLITQNAFLIFQNFLIGSARGEFGKTVQESIINTLGMQIDLPVVGSIPIGSVITKQLLGPEVASSIDKGYAALEGLEAKAEELERSKKQLEIKISQLKELLEDEELKRLYEIIEPEGASAQFKDLPDMLFEGPSENLRNAENFLTDKKFQSAAELIVKNLKSFKNTLFKAAAELKGDPTKDRKGFSEQVLIFKKSYKTGQEILLAIKTEIENIKKEIESVEAQEVEVNIAEPPTDKTQEPATEPATEPQEPEAEPTSKPETSDGVEAEEKVEFGDQNQQQFINAATRFQTEFYKQRKRKAQGEIINDLIDAIDQLVKDTELEDAYIQSPKSNQQELKENEDTEKLGKIEANQKQLRGLKLEFRTLLQRINKAKKALELFKEYARKGSSLADSTKEEFMLLLEKLQESIARISINTRKIIKTENSIKENEETDKSMDKHLQVEKLYDSSLESIISLRDLLAQKSTNVKPEELIKTAYQQLIDLSQYFPSVNPFNVGVKSKNDLKKYDAAFDTAVEDVKSSLQNVLSFIKTFETSSDSLQFALEGIEQFSAKIQSIFGVESKIKKLTIDPDSPPAVEVEEYDSEEDQQTDSTPVEEPADEISQALQNGDPIEPENLSPQEREQKLQNMDANRLRTSVKNFLSFIRRVVNDYDDGQFDVTQGEEELQESVVSRIKRAVSRTKSDKEFFDSLLKQLPSGVQMGIQRATSALLNKIGSSAPVETRVDALKILWDWGSGKNNETVAQGQKYKTWAERREREEILKAYKIPIFSMNFFKPQLEGKGIKEMINDVFDDKQTDRENNPTPAYEDDDYESEEIFDDDEPDVGGSFQDEIGMDDEPDVDGDFEGVLEPSEEEPDVASFIFNDEESVEEPDIGQSLNKMEFYNFFSSNIDEAVPMGDPELPTKFQKEEKFVLQMLHEFLNDKESVDESYEKFAKNDEERIKYMVDLIGMDEQKAKDFLNLEKIDNKKKVELSRALNRVYENRVEDDFKTFMNTSAVDYYKKDEKPPVEEQIANKLKPLVREMLNKGK